MNRWDKANVGLTLLGLALCLFEPAISAHCTAFREVESTCLEEVWLIVLWLCIWCGVFLFLTFSVKDFILMAMLFAAILSYYLWYSAVWQEPGPIMVLFGATLGSGIRSALIPKEECANNFQNPAQLPTGNFLIGLVSMLAFASWWHLDTMNNIYHGPRWTGLWNNPNHYGLLMSAGLILAVGLLAAKTDKRHKGATNPRSEIRYEAKTPHSGALLVPRSERENHLAVFAAMKSSILHPPSSILLIAAGMMAVGLLFSYSRGAWIGTAIGLLYLANAYGKFKWRRVLPPVLLVAAVIVMFWNTPRTAPWYLQRLDMSRGSVEHRLAAWKAGFEMMWGHPFGVGWNNTVEIYERHYSPPENGAVAILTNDYLMLGTQLGWVGLACFVTYCGLCLRDRRSVVVATPECGGIWPKAGASGGTLGELEGETPALRYACRAGALAMLVAFWFDGGLFKLATASVFWILLELGADVPKVEGRRRNKAEKPNLVASVATKTA